MVVGHGTELPGGDTVFVWAGEPGGRGAHGCFGSAERARHFINRLYPARLVWFDPVR